MLPFIAALPILWGAKKLYDYATDDDYETSTYSDKSDREYEVKQTVKAERNKQINQDIKAYKSKQIKRFKDKYDVDIKFYSGKSKSSCGINSIVFNRFFGVAGVAIAKELFENNLSEKISVNKKDEADTISMLEKENDEMLKVIRKLEVEIHEATN